eukprot:NODE_5927_length_949_cov_52.444310_g5340_i0.p1 GENE.NODE_5927_length_949_cov_52.444310_g5340_i0~~NODE_5927_length_949_cov_52.444310_g5340_i0.p1  ORF type:complete len:233 (+),score=49.10 NODE_5927_length_949_cov_52.444310_g5340_i0:68-700(+)
MAICGLPGMPLTQNYSINMLNAAAAIIQIFSEIYQHPRHGKEILEKVGQVKSLEETQQSTEQHHGNRVFLIKDHKTKSRYCVRIGVASGRATIGVLNGKCSTFDCWGPTINLAARMESLGAPTTIHCPFDFYEEIMATPEQPYIFESPRTLSVKGFGVMETYLVANSTQPLPEELVMGLGLAETTTSNASMSTITHRSAKYWQGNGQWRQ